jgi:hypothetical protein
MPIEAKMFQEDRIARTALVVLLLAALLSVIACSRQSGGNQQKVSPVAQGQPKLEAITPVRPAVARPMVASQGDCAPRYAVGGMGTCINNKPCRGFGVRAENGSAVCTCYGKDGGCGESDRCDLVAKRCVSEKEPLWGHED